MTVMLLVVKKKFKTVSRRDITDRSFVAKVRAEIFSYLHGVAVERPFMLSFAYLYIYEYFNLSTFLAMSRVLETPISSQLQCTIVAFYVVVLLVSYPTSQVESIIPCRLSAMFKKYVLSYRPNLETFFQELYTPNFVSRNWCLYLTVKYKHSHIFCCSLCSQLENHGGLPTLVGCISPCGPAALTQNSSLRG
jgi:hypothetical protein